MRFSVIIPDLNSPVIDRAIAALQRQDFDQDEFEVIVVGRDDPGLVHPSPQIKFDYTERPYGPAEARNRGAKQAVGEVYVFLDADCIPSTGWLTAINRALQDPEIHAVGGGVKLAQGNFWVVADNFAIFHDFLVDQRPRFMKQFPSLNLAIRRDVFWQVQGFDETYPFPAGEDFDLTFRVSQKGYRLYFVPEAWVLHQHPRNTLGDLWLHGYRLGLYSTKINPRYADQVGLPKWIRRQWRIRILSPLIAAFVTLNIFFKTPGSFKYFYTFPAVFTSKLAWCMGAADSPFLKRQQKNAT